MCTLIIAWQVFDDAPVVVAANRDEATDRASQPPYEWDGEAGVVAPRDEEAGGTWIGHNGAGLFVGISNRWTDRELVGQRSRGLLVADVLGSQNVDEAIQRVSAAVDSLDYEAFNLLVADRTTAYLVEWEGKLVTTRLEPGVHVLANAGFDDRFRTLEARPEAAVAQAESVRAVREVLQPESGESADAWLDRAADVLGDHDVGVCVHGDGYGTRSASMIAIPSNGTPAYQYADGPPCTTVFEPVEGQS